MRDLLVRLLVAGSVLGVWLAYLTSRQTSLYPTVAEPASQLAPIPVVVAAIVVGIVGRLLAPSTFVAVACMAVIVWGVALVAAQLGSPLANASEGAVGGDYCGDLCRGAIMGRTLAFFGWPLAVATGLVVLGRMDRVAPAQRAERSAWTRAWAIAALVLGLIASTIWWRIILPNG